MGVQAVGGSEQAAGPAAVEQAPADAPAPPATSGAPTYCQVPGCTDVAGLARFYRRVRICETHAKAHSITNASGRAMRFCQQCSKLQPLELFSGDRRSCATSLDKRRARRSVAAASVRASGEASPGRENAERKRRSSQGSPDAEEATGQLGLSKRHSPLRDSGSLTWSIDSFGEELPQSEAQRAPSSGRGGSSLGSPGLSTHGWPVSSGPSEEGAPSGSGLAAASPAAEERQTTSSGSPMPSVAMRGHAGVQLQAPLPALLQHSSALSVRPPLQAARPAVATSRLLPQPHASGRALIELPALAAVPLPLAEQLAQQMHLSAPATQLAQPAAHLPVPAADAIDPRMFDWIDADDVLSAFAALPPVPQLQPRSGVPMPSAELEAAAAEAAAALGVDLTISSPVDLAALGLSPLPPCSPTAAAYGSSAAGVSPPAVLPALQPASSQELQQQLQQAEQWQQAQLHDLRQQVQHLQHPAGQPSAPPSAAPSQAASLPSPLPAAAPDGSPVAAPAQIWPLPALGSDMSSGTGCAWIEVECVEKRPT